MASEGIIGKSISTFSHYFWRSLVFVLIFVLFTTNLIALALSQQCNRAEPIFFRIASGMFAFMFGILYILIMLNTQQQSISTYIIPQNIEATHHELAMLLGVRTCHVHSYICKPQKRFYVETSTKICDSNYK